MKKPLKPVLTFVRKLQVIRLEKKIQRYLLSISFALQKLKKRNYEPIKIGKYFFDGARESEKRWEKIEHVIVKYNASSVLDIGCSEGYFLRRAAEDHKCFCLGVDSDINRVRSGEIARIHDNVRQFAIFLSHLSIEDINKLPRFDVVLCLSVVHHVIREKGESAGVEFVKALSTKANKAVVFEMGTSEENLIDWSNNLPSMPDGQTQYVTNLLKSAGLTNIWKLTETPSFYGEKTRCLMVAEPNK